jgi:hypothetical protein
MKKLLVGLMLGACLGGAAAWTATATEAHAASEATALKLSRLVVSKETYREMLKQMLGGMVNGLKAQGQTFTPDKQKKLEAVLNEALPYDDILALNAKIYGARFSDKELEDVIAFYETPTGAKLIKELPGITGEAMQKVSEILPQRLPVLMKKHGLTD